MNDSLSMENTVIIVMTSTPIESPSLTPSTTQWKTVVNAVSICSELHRGESPAWLLEKNWNCAQGLGLRKSFSEYTLELELRYKIWKWEGEFPLWEVLCGILGALRILIVWKYFQAFIENHVYITQHHTKSYSHAWYRDCVDRGPPL